MGFTLQGKEVGDIGLGLMGLTWNAEGARTDEQIEAVLDAALDCGCTYWNGGEFYGPADNNSLAVLRRYFAKRPQAADRVVLNLKGCFFDDHTRIDASPAGVRRSLDACLAQLAGSPGFVHQFEPARRTRDVAVEDTVRAIDEYVSAGRVGAVALCEVGPDIIRRAARVTRIEAVEMELSLWNTDPLHNGVAQACADLGIVMLAYSPLGRGMLTGRLKSFDDLPEGDFRRLLPRYQPDVFETNLRLTREVEKLAAKKGCTAAQVAINWILAVSRRPGMPKIVPIPGASSPERVRENATRVDLTDEDMERLDALCSEFAPVGERYHKQGMEFLHD